MGGTSDGIAAADWDRVHELALAIVNAEEDSSEEIACRTQLLNYLDALAEKYGELPGLLATRADYIDDTEETERLLLRACDLAAQTGDTRNGCLISLSLAELYVSERLRPVAARASLEKARAHMSPDDESSWAESCRIEKRLEKF